MSAKCGTDHGWHRHRQLGEDPCYTCDVAHKEAVAAWTKARLEAADAPSKSRRRPTAIPLEERAPYGGYGGSGRTRCGTTAGYLLHKHQRTYACGRCQDAWDAFSSQPGAGRFTSASLAMRTEPS